MSRAIVINKTAVQRIFNSIKSKMNAIRSAGFPKEIADMSLPGFGMGVLSPLSADLPLLIDFVMSADSPVPLSLMECPLGNTAFHVPENLLPVKSHIKKVSRPATMTAQPFTRPVEPKSIPVSVPKHSEDITVSAPQLQALTSIDDKQEESEPDNNIIANSIIATMKENNLETREPETLSLNVTRIMIDDLLGQRKIRIPEYVMVRR